MKKNIFLGIAIAVIVVLIGGVCYGFYQKLTYYPQNPVATIVMKDLGTIKVELYPDKAPNTVANFIKLANNGFYNGLTFHRTIPEFMIQGGSKSGTGSGAPTLGDLNQDDQTATYAISGEFIANGYTKNTIRHERGVISMARSDYSSVNSSLITQGYNSAGSQFFIVTKDNTSLDGLYAAFGKVIEGMEVVDEIANVEVETRESNVEGKTQDRPVNPPVIESITVETYGVDYGMPKTLTPFDYTNWLLQQYNSSANSGTNTGDGNVTEND